jgi:hypothetical protein
MRGILFVTTTGDAPIKVELMLSVAPFLRSMAESKYSTTHLFSALWPVALIVRIQNREGDAEKRTFRWLVLEFEID